MFCSDRNVLIGIGLGIITATILLGVISFNNQKPLSKVQIEDKARGYGMDYPSEFKVILDKGAKK